MSRQFREARKKNNLKLTVAAKMLGVSQPTLSSWEAGRKSPTIDNLAKMADLYGVTTDYLLGREAQVSSENSPLSPTVQQISIHNKKPMWSDKYGWLLVNESGTGLITASRDILDIEAAGELMPYAPQFAESPIPSSSPLKRDELTCQTQVWVEPISPDPEMREYLRGWYQVKDRFVENEYGTKFSLDSYGAKWLAFLLR